MTPLRLDAQFVVVDQDSGEVVGFVLADVPEGAPHDVREGLVRRRLAALDGECPCGGRLVMPNRAARRAAVQAGRSVHDIRVEHSPGCPGSDASLGEALRRWTA